MKTSGRNKRKLFLEIENRVLRFQPHTGCFFACLVLVSIVFFSCRVCVYSFESFSLDLVVSVGHYLIFFDIFSTLFRDVPMRL